MAQLPSGYTPMTCLLGGGSTYIDTGVTPNSNTSIEAYFSAEKGTSSQGATATGYVFGARNSNSNTSAGQLNFYLGIANSSDYVGWASARISKTLANSEYEVSGMPFFNITSDMNEFVLCANNRFIREFNGATTSFSGTRNIYLFALNNGGTALGSTRAFKMIGFRIYKNGVLQRDFVPCYNEATSYTGMYDLVGETFYQLRSSDSSFEVITDSTTGGNAYIRTPYQSNANKIRTYGSSTYGSNPSITVVAKPQKGYAFKQWEIDGSVVSNDDEYTFTPASATTIRAVFVKSVDLETKNNYKAMCINYDSQNKNDITFMQVIKASISEDLMQKATTTIECVSVPSTIQNNIPLFLYDPKGKIIFYGTVVSVDNNTITCRSPLAIFDDDYLVSTSYYNDMISVAQMVFRVLYATQDSFVRTKKHDFDIGLIENEMSVNADETCNQLAESISSSSAVNGEDYAINLYQQYGLAFKYSLSSEERYYQMRINPYVPKYETLYLNDGMENITNLNVLTEEAETTIVDIYNSTGATLRATYGISTDGKIAKYTNTIAPFIAKTKCKRKIVMSNEPLLTIAKQNLNVSYYNHKITFDLYFNDLVRFSDIHVGQKVNFYKGNALFKSVLTAIQYEISETNDNIVSAKCTLGVVRTNLTSKLNLGRVK